MRPLLVASLVVVVGCGEDKAKPNNDAAIDAAIDAYVPIDAPPPPPNHYYFVIDKQTLPATNAQARDLAFDLDGDQVKDNQLGMVMSTLAGMGIDSQLAMDRAIDTGAAIMLGDLFALDLTTDAASTFTLYQGTNPMPPPCANAQDTVCRRHLTGMGSFTVKPGAPVDSPLMGSIAGGVLDAGPGHLTIQFAAAASSAVTVTLLGARVQLTSTATTTTGKLGGAISAADVDGKIIPALRDSFQATVMVDCPMPQSPPTCGCATNSQGKTLLGLFDTNPKDCSISVDEVRNNSLIQSLLAPDVTVENTSALSLGVGVHAVSAGFVAP